VAVQAWLGLQRKQGAIEPGPAGRINFGGHD
jgi:hypothetical protein